MRASSSAIPGAAQANHSPGSGHSAPLDAMTHAPASRAISDPARQSTGPNAPITAAEARPAPTLASVSAFEPMMRVTQPTAARPAMNDPSPSQSDCAESSVRTIPPVNDSASMQRIGSPFRVAPRPRAAASISPRYGSTTAPAAGPSSSTTAMLNDDHGSA